jgi:hypothetical protein
VCWLGVQATMFWSTVRSMEVAFFFNFGAYIEHPHAPNA